MTEASDPTPTEPFGPMDHMLSDAEIRQIDNASANAEG